MYPHCKRCIKCGATKPLDEFPRHRAKKDGIDGSCKACHRESARRWREANPEKVLIYRKVSLEKDRKRARRWRETNPEKQRARKIVERSVLAGDLPPISDHFCFVCGTSTDQGSHMDYHHVDYSKPLEVFPVCRQCHMDWHRKNEALYD